MAEPAFPFPAKQTAAAADPRDPLVADAIARYGDHPMFKAVARIAISPLSVYA